MLERIAFGLARRTPGVKRLVAKRAQKVDDVAAIKWFAKNAKPVTIVIPTFGGAEVTANAIASIKKTTPEKLVKIVVSDDAGPAEEREKLKQIEGVELILNEENAGFAANVNRGLRKAGEGDVIVLNNDVIAHDGWLEALQYAAHSNDRYGIVGPMLLYPDGRIQFAGTVRNIGAPEWFDHRYRFQEATFGPANVPAPALAITGACMYIRGDVLKEVGEFDEGFPMAFEDVDYCIRAWNAGFESRYVPTARLTHLESITRGKEVGDREQRSMDYFWEKWAKWFDERNPRTEDGKLRVIYVTEDTGVGGGHRDIFEHLNHLQERGHEVALYTLQEEPGWFPLKAPVHVFKDYDELTAALMKQDAIKIATWWNTAEKVLAGSMAKGIPLFFVQDIETSYYPGNPLAQQMVLASYRPEMNHMTISERSKNKLAELGVDAELIPPGIDLKGFRPLGIERDPNILLALGRSNPLKNLPLTIDGWKAMGPNRPELWMFGVEPRIGVRYGAKYITSPSDEEVNELYNKCGVFVQNSTHEGFCLPVLEAMATGAPVVCTDMVGNRDFCVDGENCVMVDFTPESVAAGIQKLLDDPELREKFKKTGPETAAGYSWDIRIDQVETYYESLTAPGPMLSRASDAVSATPSE
jgi:GT2 family glycosyltransferase